MKSLRFVNEQKLNDCLVQFVGSLREKDPEITKKIEIGLTGFKVSLQEKDITRELNEFQKIALLKSCLEVEKGFSKYRPSKHTDRSRWVYETCFAHRVAVPPDLGQRSNSPAFVMWISPPVTSYGGMLCLMEGHGRDNGSITDHDYGLTSRYTLLQSILYFAHQNNRAGALGFVLPNHPHENVHAKPTPTHPPSLINQFHNAKENEHMFRFFNDPVRFLKEIGCDVSNTRKIESIYEVREIGSEDADIRNSDRKSVSTFGYPFYIFE